MPYNDKRVLYIECRQARAPDPAAESVGPLGQQATVNTTLKHGPNMSEYIKMNTDGNIIESVLRFRSLE